MSTREVTVKVKLESDNRNPFPSPVAGAGGSLVPYAGGTGVTGGANASGSANPLAQNAQKAADGLAQFNQHLSKAADSMNALRDSSKGMLGTLKQMLFTGGGDSQASPGHMQALWGGAKSFMGKYGMPMAVGGSALGIAGGIVSGVTAADNFMVSRGAKPWLGHGSWDRDASGRLYDLSPTRLANEAEVAMIGGGTMTERGDIKTWDQHQANIDLRHSEAMRRTTMQAPFEIIRAQESARKADLRMQLGSMRNQFAGFKDYNIDAEMASDKFMAGMGPLLDQSAASLKKLHGGNIGELIAAQERFGVGQQGQAYGQQMADARSARSTNMMDQMQAERELGMEQSRLKDIQANKAPGDKNTVSEAEKESLQQIVKLREKIKDLGTQGIQIQDRINTLTREQVAAQKANVNQQLSSVMGSRLQEAQLTQSQKESFGMMDVGDQQYMKDVASRFKSGGIESITSEERSLLQSGPLAEDVRIQARKRADDSGFADLYRGSRAETRFDELTSRQNQLEKLSVELNKTINVKTESDKDELAREIVQVMGKYFSEIKVAVEAQAELQFKAADNQAKLSGQQRASGTQ